MQRLAILTGGGDVPGLNVVIKTVAQHCFENGQTLLGLRKGWQGIADIDPGDDESRAEFSLELTPERVRKVDRTGGTFLHSSRANPGQMNPENVAAHVDTSKLTTHANGRLDLTPVVLANLEKLGVDALVVTGGDDTLGYAAKLNAAGFPTVGVPKTMDNDVQGTDYCLGFSTAITRSVNVIQDLRTPAGSHERIAVIELFGRNSGATALFTGHLTGADRVLIAEVPFNVERLCEYVVKDQDTNPSNYAVVVISEGARHSGGELMEAGEADPYGHKKLGGIGQWLCYQIGAKTGRPTLSQRLAYFMRSGQPDALDRMVAINFGHLAYRLLATNRAGHMAALTEGRYRAVPLSEVSRGARPVDVERFYDADRYRTRIRDIEGLPMFLR